MYLEHFGLSVNPFSLSPKLDFLYQSETFAESMAHLVYGLDNQEAIVLVTGPIGTGKTMALQSFLTSLGPHYESALVTNTRVGALELLKLMLEDLGVEFPTSADKSDLLILFKNFLRESSRKGKTILLIVDEAQNLAPEVLEELRLLTNLGQGDAQPVQIILVGQPELEELVNRPDMAQIRQRIRVHYTLEPLNRSEAEEYLAHRMRVAGCDRTAFSKAAVDKIFRLSGGVPRVVNTYAGDALLSAFVAGRKVVGPADVGDEEIKGRTPANKTAAPEPRPAAVRIEPPAPAPAPSPAARQESSERPVMATRQERGRPRGMVVAVVLLVGLSVAGFYFRNTISDLTSEWFPQTRPAVTETTAQTLEQPVAVQDKAEPEQSEKLAVVLDTIPLATADTAQVPVVMAATTNVDRFFVHVSSFQAPARARDFADKWGRSGIPTLVRSEVVNGDTWNRVYVGPFATHDDALAEARRLVREGTISYYAVKSLSIPGSGR